MTRPGRWSSLPRAKGSEGLRIATRRHLPRAFATLLVATSLAFALLTPTARAQTVLLPGVDVSHWQGEIDWPQVAAAGVRFAVAKATEGRSYVDPTYITNKAGAEAAGIAFTAYHFAQPDDTAGDAIAEADHFVDMAQLVPGNLIPALDLERTGGLTQAELTQWVLTWLGRVTERLGLRPMVYTSPNGWENRTGDTTAVADAGYTVLWVAHWGVDAPRLPADDWAGYGWTFWQYTSDGTVPGIEGRVDLDVFNGPALDAVTIPSAPPPTDVTPPLATITPPAGLTDPAIVTFDERVRRVTDANLAISMPDDGEHVEVDLTCRSQTRVVDCFDGSVRTVTASPHAPLVAGQSYLIVVNPLGVAPAIEDHAGNASATVQQPFRAALEADDGSAAISYGWPTASNRRAFGGSYVVERLEGATATFSFTGRAVTWYTAVGPAQGRATVKIDGQRVGTFDQYAPRPAFRVARVFDRLARGPHTISIEVLGARSRDATDTHVVVDAFGVGREVVRTPTPAVTWRSVDTPLASGGTVALADLARASVTFAFRGTSVEWYTVRGPRQGRAAIYVDDVLIRTVDNYAPEPSFGVVRSVTGLSDGRHVVRVVVLGTSRRAAEGTLVAVDRFVAA